MGEPFIKNFRGVRRHTDTMSESKKTIHSQRAMCISAEVNLATTFYSFAPSKSFDTRLLSFDSRRVRDGFPTYTVKETVDSAALSS